jgi:hypothetical protein
VLITAEKRANSEYYQGLRGKVENSEKKAASPIAKSKTMTG